MKPIRRLMMINQTTRREDENWDSRRDGRDRQRERPAEMGYAGYEEPEGRFRDRRGREHYDNGRYAPQNYMGDDRYRPHGDDGYGPQASRYYNPHDDRYGPNPRYPGYPGPEYPPYFQGDYGPGREAGPPKMHKIGFSVDGEMERIPDEYRPDYRATAGYPRIDEVGHRQGAYQHGYGAGSETRPLDKQAAEQWAQHMKNEDGTTGPHWSMEKTKQVQAQKGIDCDPLEFWIAMNMVYSDYAEVAKKLNVNTADFYASLAEAFLDDKDAQPNKLARYYQYIVKH